MNPKRKRRLIIVLLAVAAAAVAISLTVFALQQNMNYLYSPTEIDAGKAPAHNTFRLGGVVKEHSVVRDPNSLKVQFVVTDRFHDMPVVYTGILPDLFRVGQSVIVTGHMDGHHFVGTQVLAKHDETYMPKEVADAIRKAKAKERAEAAEKAAASKGGH